MTKSASPTGRKWKGALRPLSSFLRGPCGQARRGFLASGDPCARDFSLTPVQRRVRGCIVKLCRYEGEDMTKTLLHLSLSALLAVSTAAGAQEATDGDAAAEGAQTAPVTGLDTGREVAD